MSRLLQYELEAARPPHELVPWAQDSIVCALDAGVPDPLRMAWGSGPGQRPGSMLVAEPERVFRGGLHALREALAWLDPRPNAPPQSAGLIGYLAYELGDAFEPLRTRGHRPLDPAPAWPQVWLAGFRAAYHFDPWRRSGVVWGGDAPACRRLRDWVQATQTRRTTAPLGEAWTWAPGPAPRRAAQSDAGYRAGVRAILDWIRAGDVYQVNLARSIDLEDLPDGAPPNLYALLQTRSPAPFGAYLDMGRGQRILSNSPERFLWTSGNEVQTCPIKGTRPRGRTAEEDALLAKQLRVSEKDRAEHVMIVDLERNDLGRVCEVGSVRVDALAELHSFPTLHHLVSSVRGVLRPDTSVEALLTTTFPSGSITGAPKLRAREIIHTLEAEPRGVYTGAIGCIDAAGGIDLSIAIRTAVTHASTLRLHVGGGVVADSLPETELAETRDKARAFGALWRQVL